MGRFLLGVALLAVAVWAVREYGGGRRFGGGGGGFGSGGGVSLSTAPGSVITGTTSAAGRIAGGN